MENPTRQAWLRSYYSFGRTQHPHGPGAYARVVGTRYATSGQEKGWHIPQNSGSKFSALVFITAL